MKQIVKIELLRAFKSKGFCLSLLIGCIIAIIHCIMHVLPYALKLNEYVFINKPMMYPGWLYTLWLGGNTYTAPTYLFFLITPLLSSLPHADTFFTDVKSGVIQNLCIRVSRKNYYRAKYLASFLAGGTAVISPLVLNFLLSALLLPALKPEVVTSSSLIGEYSTFPHLFFSMPLLYVAVFLFIIFAFSGLLATVSLVASYYVGYRFLVLIVPFITYLFIMSTFSLLSMENWIPINFLNPAYEFDSLIPIIIESIMLLLFTIYIFIKQGAKNDIY